MFSWKMTTQQSTPGGFNQPSIKEGSYLVRRGIKVHNFWKILLGHCFVLALLKMGFFYSAHG